MNLLDRYVLRELAAPLLFGLLAFTGLFLSIDLVPLVRMGVDYGAPLEVMVKLVLLRLPEVFMWTLSMAVLLGALLSLSRLSAASEVVAMQAATISFYRIVAPVLSVGLLVSLGTMALGEWAVPSANHEYRRVVTEDVQGGQLPTVTRNVILKEYERGVMSGFLYAAQYDGKSKTMRDVTIVEMDGGRPVKTTFARKTVWEGDTWYMEDGVTHLHDDEPGVTINFGAGRQPIAVGYRPEQVMRAQKQPEEMTIGELRDHIAVLRSRGDEGREHVLQLHLKISVPLTSFVFALIAAPLGVQPHRTASSVGFGLSMLVIFAYYVLMTVGTALAQGGHVPPALGAWLQNVVLGAVGIGLNVRSGRR